MTGCSAIECTNRTSKNNSGITFHRFPKNVALRNAWIAAVGRKDWQPTKFSSLCSKHFSEDQINRTSFNVRLKENAVPNIFPEIFYSKYPIKDTICSRRPSRRAAQVAAKKISHSVRNFTVVGSADDQSTSSKGQTSPRPYQRHKQRTPKDWHALRFPPDDIELLMECQEELLSAVQAETLLKAQSEYNMVMKTLRNLRAKNVRIICSVGEEHEPEKSPSPISILNVSSLRNSRPNSPVIKQQNVITVTPIRGTETSSSHSVVPVKLSTVFGNSNPSSPAPILS